MADRVFEDRVGLWVVNLPALPDRLPAIRAFQGGLVRDLFLPRTALAADLELVRAAGFSAHLWAAGTGLTAAAYADRALADLARLRPGAIELNIELPADAPLREYVHEVVTRLRVARRSLRMRINVAPWKGFALPYALLATDPNLYACEQNYLGNMDELLSAEDVAANAREAGVPEWKVTVCYAAACRVLGSTERVRTLPDLSRRRRGVIFHDDLMVEAGLL